MRFKVGDQVTIRDTQGLWEITELMTQRGVICAAHLKRVDPVVRTERLENLSLNEVVLESTKD